MNTSGLIEIILYVQDMNAQVAFYRDNFGLRVSYPQHKDEYSQEFWVTLDTGVCTLALHGGGQGKLGKDTPKIVFSVDEIQTDREHLVARGVEVGEVRNPAPGVWVCDGRDPEGNPFSIEAHSE